MNGKNLLKNWKRNLHSIKPIWSKKIKEEKNKEQKIIWKEVTY